MESRRLGLLLRRSEEYTAFSNGYLRQTLTSDCPVTKPTPVLCWSFEFYRFEPWSFPQVNEWGKEGENCICILGEVLREQWFHCLQCGAKLEIFGIPVPFFAIPDIPVLSSRV